MSTRKNPVTVQQAIIKVANNPEPSADPVDMPVHEMVSHVLFDIANNPNAEVRGSMARANRARKMLMDRMAGTRRAGTAPAVRERKRLDFVDLTDPTISDTEIAL